MENIEKIRKKLHQNPELSGNEQNTARYIINLLEEWGIDECSSGFAQYSILARIKGDENKKSILFRCELDALPIEETNSFNHRSKTDGVSHKCGHDGHMSIILGLIQTFMNEDWNGGDLFFLFQSAEETGEGAREIINSNFLADYKIDYAFALHNVPGFKKHTVICKEDVFTPTVESFKITIKGATIHAGEPDKGKNPALFIADFVQYMNDLHQPSLDNNDSYFVVAPIFITMGEEAFGTSAGRGEAGYTIRSITPEVFEKRKEEIIAKAKQLGDEKELSISFEWIEPFKANENNKELVEIVKKATETVGVPYLDKEKPFDWGEDFGLFSQHYRTAMFALGSGEDAPPLHDSNYDFPDDIAPTGVNVFYQIAKQIEK